MNRRQIPIAYGSVTPSVALVATAGSIALPPSRKASIAPSAASASRAEAALP